MSRPNQLSEQDLPPGRHRLLKEHLMTEIRREDSPKPARAKWLRPALAATAVAAVAASALTQTPSGGTTAPRASTEATALLDQIAFAAGEEKAPTVRDDQFVYIKSKVSWSGYDLDSGTAKIEPVRVREAWHSVDGKQRSMANDPYRHLDHELLEATYGDATSTAYRNLQTLPTDTDKMYDWLNSTSEGGNSKQEANFDLVGHLVQESLMPPAQAAALYRAAAKIDGVFVVDDAVDAAGRHGVAVARVDRGQRFELIFDKKTKEYLGERRVALKDMKGGIKKGDVTARTAVLERGVVDKRGLRP